MIKQSLPQLLTIWSSHNFFSINLQWSWVDYLFLIYLVILTFKWKFLLHITFLIYLWWRISISAIQRTYTDKIILPIINHESPTKGHGQLARQRRALGFLVETNRAASALADVVNVRGEIVLGTGAPRLQTGGWRWRPSGVRRQADGRMTDERIHITSRTYIYKYSDLDPI